MVPQVWGPHQKTKRLQRFTHFLSLFLSFSLTHTLTCACLGGKMGEHCKICKKKKKNQPGYFLFSSPNLKKQVQNNLK